MAADYRTLKMALLADTSKFTSGMSNAQRHTQTFGDKMKGIAKGIGTAFATAGVAIAGMATKLAIDGVKAYSDFTETTSKVNVIFGKNAKAIQEWSKTAATSFGQSQTTAMNAASDFATFGKSAGLQGKELVKFSKKLTVLSSDFASFNNTSPEDAIIAIGAALRGESEPIRRYGVLLNDATLKAKAMDMGLYNGKGTLDMSAKVLASYQTILDQTTDAQGDFTRTADGLANGQRTITALWDDAQITIGEALYPAIKDMVNFLTSEKGQKMIKDFAEAFAESMKAVAKVLPGIVDKITKVVKAVSKQGLVAGLLSDPQIAVAALAYGAGFAAGGPAGGAIAAIAAYSMTSGITGASGNTNQEANRILEESIQGSYTKKQRKAINRATQLFNLGMSGSTQAAVSIFSGDSKAGWQALGAVNNVVINFNGQTDPRRAAREIEKALKKINLNGGTLKGTEGFN